MEKLLDGDEAAALLGLTPNTLAKHRVRGTGPAFVRLGTGQKAPIRYRPTALEAWLTEARSTSELGQ